MVSRLATFALAIGGLMMTLNPETLAAENPRVVLETSKGAITIELYPEQAPKTVENFLGYVDAGFFAETIFHRVIPGFMIQGGGFTSDMQKKPTRAPITNESDNGLTNDRGTIAMARTSDPHSATAQFFINTVDNTPLNHTGKAANAPFNDTGKAAVGWGYAVFGKVVDGMEAVDAISGVPTGRVGRFSDVPRDPVFIESARRLEASAQSE